MKSWGFHRGECRMNGNGGRGGHRTRKPGNQQHQQNQQQNQKNKRVQRGEDLLAPKKNHSIFDKKKFSFADRPKWVPPAASSEAVPERSCTLCGKKIESMAEAIGKTGSTDTFHIDCLIKKLSEREKLEPGDAVYYIGGGRFGIIHLDENRSTKFTIKRVIEWEARDERQDWRKIIADHFSIV
jgi:hypothetical protein